MMTMVMMMLAMAMGGDDDDDYRLTIIISSSIVIIITTHLAHHLLIFWKLSGRCTKFFVPGVPVDLKFGEAITLRGFLVFGVPVVV